MNYQVQLRPSGHVFTMQSDETVLDAALRQGFVLPYSCRTGSCGICIGKILQGDIVYPQGTPEGIEADEIAAGKALLCQARPAGDLLIETAEIEAVRDIPIRTLPCRVIELKPAASDVMRVWLKPPAAGGLRFLPGQYVDILLRDGRWRSFSLANAPSADGHLELHIRRVPGGHFTDYVFTELQPKTILRIRGPLGSFFLREDSTRPIIMMGGGTGFAPLKSMLEHVFRKTSIPSVHLYWGARSEQDLYMAELPEYWQRTYAGFTYTPVLSEASWQGRSGWVHQAICEDYPLLNEHDVYMSGPPPMIHAGKKAFLARGLPAQRLFYDSFEFAADSQPTVGGKTTPESD